MGETPQQETIPKKKVVSFLPVACGQCFKGIQSGRDQFFATWISSLG